MRSVFIGVNLNYCILYAFALLNLDNVFTGDSIHLVAETPL
jgi:hypothetical protein